MAEPRWLDDDERAAWLQLIATVTLLPAALDSQLQRDSGVTHFDWVVLVFLSGAPDRTLQMSTLAGRASSSLSRLSHVVAKLERKGWVRREPCPTDARATNAVLTDAGEEKVVATAPGHLVRVRELVFDGIDPTDVAALTAVTARLLARLDPDRDWAPDRT